MPRGDAAAPHFERVLQMMHDGYSLRQACKECGIVASTMHFYVANGDDDIKKRYAHAREALYDSQVEAMEELEQQVLNGDIDPQAYRAAMDTRRWRLGKLMPKKYGDKIQQEISGPDGGPVRVEDALAAGRNRAAGRDKPSD